MRFIAFIKENKEQQVDPDLIAFGKWILKSKIAVNGPQAGLAQVRAFLIANEVKDAQLWLGFTKWAVGYFKEPTNQLPKGLKDDLHKLIAFTRCEIVYY